MKDVIIIANPSSGQEQVEEYSLKAKEIFEKNIVMSNGMNCPLSSRQVNNKKS